MPHGQARSEQGLLGLRDREPAEVEDRGGQRGVGTGLQRVGEVLRGARAAGGDDGHADRLADRARQLEVVAVVRAVAVHRGQQDLPRAALDALARPRDDVAARRGAPAGHMDLPALAVRPPAGVDGEHDALVAEHARHLGDELGPRDRRGVHRHLVGTGVEHGLRVGRAADPPADRERHEDLVGGAARELDDRVALLVRGGDGGLERYEPAFRDAEVTGDVLPDLNEADLEKLGLPLGPRKSCCGRSPPSWRKTSPTPRTLVPRPSQLYPVGAAPSAASSP